MSKLKARLIIELMGRPAPHLKEALNTLIVKMGSEEGVEMIEKKYHDPKKVKDSKDLYSNFAEIDLEFDNMEKFFGIVLGYMPSNVEVYEPEKFKMNVNNVNTLAGFIVSKLHRYDEIAKKALTERDIVLSQLEFIRKGGKIEEVIERLKKMGDETEKKSTSSKKKKKK